MKTKASAALNVFFDGKCPVCNREIEFFRSRVPADRIVFVDISDPAFAPSEYGRSFVDFTSSMKALRDDGSWLDGVDVFRVLYREAGFGWLAWITELPVVRTLAGWGYRIFARNRVRWFGGCDANTCRV